LPALRPLPKIGPRATRRAEKPTKAIIEAPITVKALSSAIGVKASDIIGHLMRENVLVTINEAVDEETAEMVAMEFGVELEIRKAVDVLAELIPEEEEDRPEDLRPRAPIVAFLGHVDHGKTSLLDSIRKTSVAEHEAGGITQHMGAHCVEHDGKRVIFLDTPGHEAFTAMRARGANVTDVVVLVVAADDGVMPQTIEAIDHARAADVPIVVALNKMDKPDANAMRAKQQLATHGLNPEEWGGDTVVVECSAIANQGIEDLLEMLTLVADMRELKANPNKAARGTTLEARMHEGRGVVATMLVSEGTLHRGDAVYAGTAYGRIRLMIDDTARHLKAAEPSQPVEVSGLSMAPEAGEKFYVVDNIQQARQLAEAHMEKVRASRVVERKHITLENLFDHIAEGNVQEVRVIAKADVQGSIEVLTKLLADLSHDEVRIRTLHAAPGGINESDVLLADASDAVIIGFNVTADDRARQLAEEKGVEIRRYQVIYEIADDMKAALEGLLAPEEREVILGHAEILRVYRVSRIGSIAGCAVRDGVIPRNASVRLIRDSVVVYTGRIESLRIEKNDAREVRSGFECGIKIQGYDDIKEGDVIEAFEIQEVKRVLE